MRYVLEGSVRKAGNRVRITGQLIDTTTGVAANAHLGHLDKARAELSRMLTIDPKLTIAGFRDLAHYLAPEVLELYVTGLRLAGLPER